MYKNVLFVIFVSQSLSDISIYYSENCRIFHLRVLQLQVEPYLSSRCKHILCIIVNPFVRSSVFAAASCCLRRHQLSCLSFNVAQDTLTFRLIKECGLVHYNIRPQMHPRRVFQVFTPVLGDVIVSLRKDINTGWVTKWVALCTDANVSKEIRSLRLRLVVVFLFFEQYDH